MQGSRANSTLAILLVLPAFLSACGAGPNTEGAEDADAVTTDGGVPTFEVDPTWPRRCPTTGFSVR